MLADHGFRTSLNVEVNQVKGDKDTKGIKKTKTGTEG
jgi:hypothetical protein